MNVAFENGTVFILCKDGEKVACGYLMSFEGKGIYSPDGKVEVTKEQLTEHNNNLQVRELETLKKYNKGVLYLTETGNREGLVSQWAGNVIARGVPLKKSWHNMAGPNGRTDVWFDFDGSTWHGVNIGDNQILRVKRNKR